MALGCPLYADKTAGSLAITISVLPLGLASCLVYGPLDICQLNKEMHSTTPKEICRKFSLVDVAQLLICCTLEPIKDTIKMNISRPGKSWSSIKDTDIWSPWRTGKIQIAKGKRNLKFKVPRKTKHMSLYYQTRWESSRFPKLNSLNQQLFIEWLLVQTLS